MVATQTMPAGQVEFSWCGEQPLFAAEAQPANPKTDVALLVQVDRALWNNGMLRSTDYEHIQATVKAGFVFLSGHTSSTSNQQLAEEAARAVPGVLGVQNGLVSDNLLKREVAGALGSIEHEYGVKFFTGVQNGVVVINGRVADAQVRTAAERCAAGVPGVRGVISSMRYPGFDLKADDPRFLQPVIGEQIYSHDGQSGKVQRVIIDPGTRRVVAMVVQGRYSTGRLDPSFLQYGEAQTPHSLVVIPVSALRYLTQNSGFLNEGAQSAGFRVFDPANYVSPSAAWRPPFPYCAEEVLFPVELSEFLPESEAVSRQ